MYPTQLHSYLLWRSSVKPDAQTLASHRFTATMSLVPAAMAGIFVFGWWAGLTVAVAMATALVVDYFLHRFVYTESLGTRDCTWMLTGLLLGLLLPPNVPLAFPIVGAALAVCVGKHYLSVDNMPLLQPAAVGLLALHLLGFAWLGGNPMLAQYGGQPRWPVLARGIEPAAEVKPKSAAVRKMLRDFFGGDVRKSVTRGQYRNAVFAGQTAWYDAEKGIAAEAVHGPRPIDLVKANPGVDITGGTASSSGAAGPAGTRETYDWLSMVLGYVPSTTASSGLALGLGILFLLFSGAASPLVPGFALATMFTALHFLAWLNCGYVVAENIPIHLLTGSTIVGLFYLAADPTTAPRSVLGKVYAGVAVGLVEVVLRVSIPSLAEGIFISIIIVQLLSFVIDQWLAPPGEEVRPGAVGITTSSLGRL